MSSTLYVPNLMTKCIIAVKPYWSRSFCVVVCTPYKKTATNLEKKNFNYSLNFTNQQTNN